MVVVGGQCVCVGGGGAGGLQVSAHCSLLTGDDGLVSL